MIEFAVFDSAEEGIEQIKKALKKFGIHVYDDPRCEGSSTYGLVLSDSKLTNAQIKEECADDWE